MDWLIHKAPKQQLQAKNAELMGKKTKGRKRHIVVNTMGNLLSVVVHVANIHDTKSGILSVRKAMEKYPALQAFCADAGYRGTFAKDVPNEFGLKVDISEKIKPHQWEKLPWRWVVERTFGWMNASRRLSKDFEISVAYEEAMIKISNITTLLRCL